MKIFSILFNVYRDFVYNYKVFNGKIYLTFICYQKDLLNTTDSLITYNYINIIYVDSCIFKEIFTYQ